MKKDKNIENIEAEAKETETAGETKAAPEKVSKREKAPKRRKFNPRSFKHGTLSVVLTVVFIAAVVVVNVIVGLISERFDTTADLTDDGMYSLEESTEKYLELSGAHPRNGV